MILPLPFVLASTGHGTMILNYLDRFMAEDGIHGFGVGFQILAQGACEPQEVNMVLQILDVLRADRGNDILALDIGANIGTHTIEWARHMTEWGNVAAFEAQERIYYALAGNIAINNAFNASAFNVAVGSENGTLAIPIVDYCRPSSFGSLELRQRSETEPIGQEIDYTNTRDVPMTTIDDFRFSRADLIKIDVEGMELSVLDGAVDTITRSHPIMLIETIKTDKDALEEWLSGRGYKTWEIGINLLAVHGDDPCSGKIVVKRGQA